MFRGRGDAGDTTINSPASKWVAFNAIAEHLDYGRRYTGVVFGSLEIHWRVDVAAVADADGVAKCWAMATEPSRLIQATRYIVPVDSSITGVPRAPQWSLISHWSIAWVPLTGVPSRRSHS